MNRRRADVRECVMNGTFRQTCETLDRELGALMRRCPDPQPDPQAVARIRAALRAETLARRRQAHLATFARRVGSVAAAAVLVFALARGLRPAAAPIPPTGQPDRVLTTWAEAVEESREQVERLWTADMLTSLDAESGYDLPLESLEESFESLERLIGT